MAEGLNPIETGKKLHEHASKADEQSGQAEREGSGKRAEGRHSRITQICEAVLLALVTIAAAWAGYAAAKWNTTSRVDIASSGTLRNLATRADLEAISIRNLDSSMFNAWFAAVTLDNPRMEAIAVRRFRPAYRVAFNAWRATDPLHNPNSPPGPSYMPQYKIAQEALANRLDNAASVKFAAGEHAGVVSDNYVRITVFFAAVLFLVGIGSTFKLTGIRYALIGFGSVVLIVATTLLLLQPGLPQH